MLDGWLAVLWAGESDSSMVVATVAATAEERDDLSVAALAGRTAEKMVVSMVVSMGAKTDDWKVGELGAL